jgi:hypothetical protein
LVPGLTHQHSWKYGIKEMKPNLLYYSRINHWT